jgi:hypothetical protein
VGGQIPYHSLDVEFSGDQLWVSVGPFFGAPRHLVRFDPATLDPIRHLVVPPPESAHTDGTPHDLAVAQGNLLMTEVAPGALSVVDTSAGEVVSQAAFATDRIMLDGDQVWVPAYDGRATAVDPATGELTRTIALPRPVWSMVPAGGGTYWAADPYLGEAVKLQFPT